MQLRQLPLLWRDATSIQIGTDPRWAVILAELSPPAARALVKVPSGASARAIRQSLSEERVEPDEIEAVLGHLRAAHLLVEPSGLIPADPDARAWALLEASGDAVALFRREHSRVRIVGLGRLGASLAHVLTLSGVGTLELEGGREVEGVDVGFGGLRHRDLGESHEVALARALHDLRPTTRIRPPAARAPDLTVLVAYGSADPLRHVPLRDAGVAHLPVVINEASVTIGPLVTSRPGPCLTCMDLHRSDADPRWPTVAAQLVARPPGVEEAAVALVGGAVAAGQVLAHLDGRPNPLRDTVLDVALPSLMPRTQHWPAHPQCGCGGQLAVPTAVRAGPRSAT